MTSVNLSDTKWWSDIKVCITKPYINGVFISNNLGYDKSSSSKRVTVKSSGYSNDTDICTISTTGRDGSTTTEYTPDPQKCPDPHASCIKSNKMLYIKKNGEKLYGKRCSSYIFGLWTPCYNDNKVGDDVVCKCLKETEFLCDKPNLEKTLNINPLTVSASVNGIKNKVILGVKYDSWNPTGNNKQPYKGNVNITFFSKYLWQGREDNFLLTQITSRSIISWLKNIKNAKPQSTGRGNLLPTLLQNYLLISTITTVIFSDFSTQLYRKEGKGQHPFVLHDMSDSTWWNTQTENVQCYINKIVSSFCGVQTNLCNNKWENYIKCLLNRGEGLTGINLTGINLTDINLNTKKSRTLDTGPTSSIIHIPRPTIKDNEFYLTFTLPFEEYCDAVKNGGLAAYSTDLMIKILRDTDVSYYDENGDKDPGYDDPILGNSKEDQTLLICNIGSDPDNPLSNSTSSNKFPSVLKCDKTKNDDYPHVEINTDTKTIPYIIGVNFKMKVEKWSPMLLLYYLKLWCGFKAIS